jgi:hypothetical protein
MYLMASPSFNEEYWSKQPLQDFIAEAALWKWSVNDAIVYHHKILKERGKKPTQADVDYELSLIEPEATHDSTGQNTTTASPASEPAHIGAGDPDGE